ncbi:MAG TPA: tRNA lysidine(34) synthetase TilS, partial [Longimicrobiaceae bacterium]|nr:tRNA lysidine(34) synthetase TilS [Longimicrobiaceae bacterium]
GGGALRHQGRMVTRRSTPARSRPAPLEERFRAHLAELGLTGEGTRLLVAVSGGCDSVALLHLLRFGTRVPLHAAHLDHAMRPGSEVDARWVAGLCRAWDVPLALERSEVPLHSEAAARRRRYAFLKRAAAEAGASHLATAHHADDQAETVLFRVLRGTGPAGLAGIAPTAAGIVRPLLPFWRREVREYARHVGLRWREDPTNRSEDPARNLIRLRLLPLIERTVSPRARRSLVRLAELAREDEAAWSALLGPLEDGVARWEGDALLLARNPLRSYDLAIASRILRNSLRQFGVVLDRTGTRLALQFITGAPSGRETRLPGGLRLATEFEVVRVERLRPDEPAPDRTLTIAAGDPPEEDRVRIGGRGFRVSWWTAPWGGEDPGDDTAVFPLAAVRFPLRVRGWLPGDRIRASGGTRTLKKLFGERRVPRSARARVPVVADAGGAVIWVPRVERLREPRPEAGQTALFLSIVDD